MTWMDVERKAYTGAHAAFWKRECLRACKREVALQQALEWWLDWCG